jgi:glycosyltransferase involved in cell wall biosynthesis
MGASQMTRNIKLSICMIVKNEEKNLPRCLESIKNLVNKEDVELIIVDTGSTDKTVEIARKYTDKVYYHEWNHNFSDMRNKSISYANGEWIFILDADEEVEDERKIELLLKSRELNKYNTVIIREKNYLTHSKEKYVIHRTERFFRNDGFRYEGSVHNQPKFKSPVLYVTDIWLHHYGYNNDDKELMEKKFKRTSELLKKEIEKDPNNIYYHFQLARTYSMHGDLHLGHEEIRTAYNILKSKEDKVLSKKYIYVFNEHARISFELGLYEETAELCREALAINTNYIDLYYYLGKSLEKLGKDEESYKVFKQYLKLYKKYNEENFDDDGLLEQYKLDIDSKNEIQFRIAQYYHSIGRNEKAFKYLQEVTDNYAKTLLMTKICLDIKDYNRLFEYYSKLEEQIFKNLIINAVEEELAKNKDEDLIRAFSQDDSLYGDVNKIRLCESATDLKKNVRSVFTKYEVEDNLKLYIEIFKVMIENNIPIIPEYKKINSSIVKKIVLHLIQASDKYVNYFQEYLLNAQVRENDFQTNRVYIAIANVYLLHKLENEEQITEEIAAVFNSYITQGINYIKFKYEHDKLNYIYRFEENQEEKFLMLMTLMAQQKENGLFTQVMHYIKEAGEAYPYFARCLQHLTKELKFLIDGNKIISEMHEISAQKNNLKVLHGTIEIANQISTIVNAQNQIDNVIARGLNYYPNYLNYENSFVIDISVNNQNTNKMVTQLLETAINTFDIFHLHYGTSFTRDLSDIPLLVQSKKKVFMHHWGSDVRRLSIAKKINPYAKSKNHDENSIVKHISFLGKYINDCIVADLELYEYVKDFYNRVHFVRQAIDVRKYVPNPEFKFRKHKPIIVHAPTSSDFKGTQFVNAAIEELKLHYDFEYILVQNMAHEEAKRLYQEADIIVDQLHSAGHGLLSLEAMAMKKPVICSISEFMKDFYPKELPIVDANPDNIKDKIELLIKNVELREELGNKGRMYVEKYHDHHKIALELLKLYKS